MSRQPSARPEDDDAAGETESPPETDATGAARHVTRKAGELSPRSMIAAFAVPWIMVLAVLGAAIGGGFLDRWLNTTPWLTIALIVLGVLGGGLQAYRSIMKALRGK